MTVLATMACVVSSTGIARPAYADIYETLQSKFQAIYGSDAYIDPDSQDGQMLAIVAKAIDDSNAAAVACYNAYAPSTAQGTGLSNAVKINGIARLIPTKSTVTVTIGGNVGAAIVNGVVSDVLGQRWDLPALVTIPGAATIDVTATAQEDGSIEAEADTVTTIETPTLGWQSVNNAAAATQGAPVESDAALRQRQALNVALPSQTPLETLQGAILDVTGVTAAKVYENDTNATDANGIPAHSIAAVVTGGAAADIAAAIAAKKTEGCYTYGTTSYTLTDAQGLPETIRYFIPDDVRISVAITIKALAGYTSLIGDELKQAIADYITAFPAGQRVDLGRIYLPAQLFGAANSSTYEVNVLQLSIYPAAPTAADVPIAFNEKATCDIADIALTVTT